MQHCVSNVLPTEQDMHGRRRIVIGVGGSIGTGKTTACKIFEDLGAHYISADEIGWEVLAEISDVLKKKFGKEIINGGPINKRKLRAIIFSNRENLKFLNELSHPILTKKILTHIKNIKSGMIIIDAALLFDWPEIYKKVDHSILVVAEDNVKAERAREKGIDQNLFKQILGFQKRDYEMAQQAKFIIKNNATIMSLKKQCQNIYEEIKNDC